MGHNRDIGDSANFILVYVEYRRVYRCASDAINRRFSRILHKNHDVEDVHVGANGTRVCSGRTGDQLCSVNYVVIKLFSVFNFSRTTERLLCRGLL